MRAAEYHRARTISLANRTRRNMARKIGFFTMDVITDLAFAKPFGNLKNDKDMHDYIRSTEAMVPIGLRMTAIPALRTLFQTE